MVTQILSALRSIFTKDGAILLGVSLATIYAVNNSPLKDMIKRS